MHPKSILLRSLFVVLVTAMFMAAQPQAEAETRAFNFFEMNEQGPLPPPIARFLDTTQCAEVYFQEPDLSDAAFCLDDEGGWLFRPGASSGADPVRLPALPIEPGTIQGTFFGDTLFAATRTKLYSLQISGPAEFWAPVYTFPDGVERDGPVVALNGEVYVLSTSGGLVYDPRLKASIPIMPAPDLAAGSLAFASGDSHIFVVSQTGSQTSIRGYHATTDTWFDVPPFHVPAELRGVAYRGTSFTLVGRGSIVAGNILLRPLPFGLLDSLAIALVGIALLSIGLLQSRHSKSNKDYFRAGGSIPWWAAGLSIFATGASAISMMSMPAMAFAGNWTYFSLGIYSILIMFPLFLLVFVPVIRRLKMPTANAYLEQRFGLSVRLLGFFSFSLNQVLGRVAAIMLLPAIAFNSIFGIPMTLSILLTGLGTTVFVTIGGLRAVIWTDVLLAIVMIMAVMLTLGFLVSMLDVSLLESWSILQEKNKLRVFDFRVDWAAPVALVLLLNTIATSLGFISDQNFLQRVQSTKSERAAKWASVSQLMVAVPLNVLLFSIGSLLFIFFMTRPEQINPAMKMDGILPYFAAVSLPPGLGGIVVAALLAATVSTISSALNSVSNLGVEDIYKRFNPQATEAKCMILARILTVVLGIAGTLLAIMLANISGMQSVWNLFLMVTGLILGPVTGIFILGIFTNRANSLGVWIGFFSAVAANAYATLFMNLHATVFIVIGLTITLIVGYLASYLSTQPSLRYEGLTIYSLPRSKDAV